MVCSKNDEYYNQEFKQQVDKFTSVSKAYSLATKINKAQNLDYKSTQSTLIETKVASLYEIKNNI